jgi:hypothetical protein
LTSRKLPASARLGDGRVERRKNAGRTSRSGDQLRKAPIQFGVFVQYRFHGLQECFVRPGEQVIDAEHNQILAI